MKQILTISTIIAVMATLSLPSLGASSFLGGYTGGICTPDGLIQPTKSMDISFHDTQKGFGGTDVKATGALIGLSPNLEVGVAFIGNDTSNFTISSKYRVVSETATAPALLIGVFDAAGSANFLSADPSLYIVLSKNITGFASDATNSPQNPMRATIGVGSGVFNGFFAGLDYALQPKLSVIAEFNGGNIGGSKNLFNAGIRYAALPQLRIDAAFVGFKQIALGASYRIMLP